ncbi:hypothetical protein JCM10908_004180 [Rhodotorula pacifica]|uniref:uncharacterized protein n=1 Tax=Rhodotorula pacifica TaxID=1495444 RepID=UPI003170504D
MVASISAPAHANTVSPSYPPQNSLEAALNSRQRTESMATVNLNQQEQLQETKTCNHHHQQGDEAEAMRLRGGCFSLEPCGYISSPVPDYWERN